MDKLTELQNKHFSAWLKERQAVFNELSDKQDIFCCCGRLASGLHESNCGRFRAKVNKETVKRLEYLLK